MEETMITVPIGPGKGTEKPMLEALQAVIMEMRGHVRDLRDTEEIDQANLLERYMVVLDLIWQQSYQSSIFGAGIQEELARQARKYKLDLPQRSIEDQKGEHE